MPSPYHKDLYPTDDLPELHVRHIIRLHRRRVSAREIGRELYRSYKATYSDEHVREIIRAHSG